MPAFLSFENYVSWVFTNYGSNIQDCDKERIMPAMDLVYIYALSIYTGNCDCFCSTTEEVPDYFIDAIYKGTYNFKEVETEEAETQDRWKDIVFNELRNNGGIVVDC